jgi:cephalosporin-C deacetylase-like acetyl esterase
LHYQLLRVLVTQGQLPSQASILASSSNTLDSWFLSGRGSLHGLVFETDSTLSLDISCALDPKSKSIAVLGLSFGGYLAAHAAAFKPRLSAVLLDGGIYDYQSALLA